LIPEHIWAADVSSVFTWVIASCELIVVNVNGKTYSGYDEVILEFQEHFRSLSTFDKSVHKEIRYHQEVEVVNKYITEMSKEELILPVTEEEITTSIASIG
jgi:hypothetical protein